MAGDFLQAFKEAGISIDSSQKNNVSKNRKRNQPYIGAPYNFVPIANCVYEKKREEPLNKISPDLISGEIGYTITAHTPIIIDNGNGRFYQTSRGNYAIPGSSIRGLIRSNVQILSFSSVYDDIDDYALMYRHITGADKTKYNRIIGTDNSKEETKGMAINVKAGFITLKNGSYYIQNADQSFYKGTNYLMLSSRYILDHKEDFPFFIHSQNDENMMYTSDCIFQRMERINGEYKGRTVTFLFYTKDKDEVYNCLYDTNKFTFKTSDTLDNKLKEIKITKIGSKNKYHNKGTVNLKNEKIDRTISYEPIKKSMINKEFYEPYYKMVYYQTDSSHKVIKVEGRDGDTPKPGMHKGWVLSSGWMHNKKKVYIIPENSYDAENPGFELSDMDIKSFKADFHKRKNLLRQYFHSKETERSAQKKEQDQKALAFFGLPQKNGERKPVFYIGGPDDTSAETGGKVYFGFTPRLRLFYNHTIRDGLPDAHKEWKSDYAKSIFGYSKKDAAKENAKSVKSKVYFTDAVIQSSPEELDAFHYIPAEPKPTSFLDYLRQTDKKDPGQASVTYNTSSIRLRGIKQYWLHQNTIPVTLRTGKNANIDVKESFVPVSAESADRVPAKFTGKIRFKNMTREELGLLLWSICLDGKSRMNIGKAKAYGYGNISIALDYVNKLDLKKAYAIDNKNPKLALNPFTKISINDVNDVVHSNAENRYAYSADGILTVNDLIKSYKDHMNDTLNILKGNDIDSYNTIRDFFTIKDPEKMPDETDIRYMSIDNKEYQHRGTISLKTIHETAQENQ